MNKYQEALDKIENAAYYGGEKGDNIELLQELVDRATPKKPIDDKCPHCGEETVTHDILDQELDYDYEDNMLLSYSTITYNNEFCYNCGQAIERSEDK